MAVLETGIQEVDPRHALDVGRLERAGWKAMTPLTDGLRIAYRDFLAAEAARKAQ